MHRSQNEQNDNHAVRVAAGDPSANDAGQNAPFFRLFQYLLFLSIAVLSIFPSVVSSQDTPTDRSTSASRDSAYYFDAGIASVREIAGERVIEGMNGVKIIHGNVTVTSDRGIHYQKSRLTYLIGNVNIDQEELHMTSEEGEYRGNKNMAILKKQVRIIDRGLRITCDEAIYYRTAERAWLKGNVVVVDSSTTLTADSLYYDKQRLISEAFGDVVIVDRDEGIRVRGNHGYYYREQGEGIMDVLPRLVVDPESNEPAVVDSDTMRFYPDEGRAVAYKRVKILKGDMVTQCDSAVVIDNEKRAELYGRPLAKQGNVSMQGDVMILGYNEEEINRIKIVGEAMIRETPRDTLIIKRDSWVVGDSMMLFVQNNRLDSIHVSGTAISEYYPQSPDRVESNYVKGDSMFFFFKNDSLSYVKIIGGSDGLYRYVNLKAGETADSLRAVIDTSLTYVPFPAEAEDVTYAGDTIQYYAKRRDLVLTKRAKVDYRGKTLIGDHITYYSNMSLLDATGTPVLVEGADKLYGNQMDYDMDTGVGLVQEGSTKFMEGYYNGKTMAKVGDNVLKVWDSRYTTCDRKVPHYHFTSGRMKVYLDDKVVTGPVVLYIGETPLAALPFFAQNIRRGRRSGILRPDFEFGFNTSRDRFVRNIGYYWATNDYTDFNIVGDFNEDKSIRTLIENRYKLRYVFNGGFKFSFLKNLTNSRSEWTLSANHNQNLGEKSSLTSDLRFVSSDRAPKAVSRLDEVADVIDRRIESRMSLRKSWNSVGFSASARRTQLLDPPFEPFLQGTTQDTMPIPNPEFNPNVVRVSTQLPSISLSIPSRSLYFGKERKQGQETLAQKVLGGIRYSPSFSMNRKTDEKKWETTEVITANAGLNFSSPFRIKFLSLSPRLAATDRFERTVVDVATHDEIDVTTTPWDTTFIQGGRTTESENFFNWNTGVGLNTNFYGTFYPELGALRGIRHTITPSASYSFQPSVQGRPSSQRVSVNLKNAIDLKVRSGDEDGKAKGGEEDEGDEEEKLRKLSGVLLWTLSSSYNPDAPSKRGWSTISSLVNLRVLGTSVSINNSIDPYSLEVESTRLTSGLTLGGTHPFGTAAEAAAPELNVVAADTAETEFDTDRYPEQDTEGEEEKGLPWNVSAAFSYSKSSFGDANSTLNLNGSISLTRSWRISYRTTYDVMDRDFLGEYISVTRDLHCWEMSFTRQKLGDEWEFYFRINLKAHPELYAEEGQRGLGRGFGSPFSY
ncbi:MAG: hypothetical protein JSW58_02785 [Candidatus Latescibacterota bacterium]|nr:MAG: hypothetical protein JSW58_02785 [Candidatus Latescibacterota bacterium]